jgi:hypothetical protein
MSSAEILESCGLGPRVRRDDGGSDGDVGRAHVEAAKGGSGGPLHIHLLQEQRFIVQTRVPSCGAASDHTCGPEGTFAFRPRSPVCFKMLVAA